MAKTYADSVKLPNLVAVQHPSARLSHKSTLNIEGHSNKTISAKSLDRRNYITSLIGLLNLIINLIIHYSYIS